MGTRTLLQMLALLAVSTAAVAQQAPTTDPRVQQPNGATVPQAPRDMGPATPEGTPDTSREDGTTSPETASDISETEPETARDVSDTEPETARDISDRGPETARDITDRGPETARDVSDRGPETARDISDREPETASDSSTTATEPEQGSQTRVATPEADSAAPPNTNAVRSIAQLQQAESSGCWVRIYDSTNFAGRGVTLVGATSMRALDGAIRSIEVGPNASVTTYRAEDFGGSTQRFDRGLKVPENDEDFGSLRITCARPTPGTPPRG
jgi:hypothetical protein